MHSHGTMCTRSMPGQDARSTREGKGACLQPALYLRPCSLLQSGQRTACSFLHMLVAVQHSRQDCLPPRQQSPSACDSNARQDTLHKSLYNFVLSHPAGVRRSDQSGSCKVFPILYCGVRRSPYTTRCCFIMKHEVTMECRAHSSPSTPHPVDWRHCQAGQHVAPGSACID